jgi:cysteine desulfurase / selenocysteine lyase
MPETPNASDPFQELRHSEFGALEGAAYLNTASLGPLARSAAEAMRAYSERRTAVHEMSAADFFEPVRRARAEAARLIGAAEEEIALLPNTSSGVSLAATGLVPPNGSTVLVSDREFPANVLPWKASARLRSELLPVNAAGEPDESAMLERLAAGDVGVLAISSVQFTTGFRADLDTLGRACREQGTIFFVDAIQSLGQIPLDVGASSIDVLATGGHKWLCGPFGCGFAYVRRAVQANLPPPFIGWTNFRSSEQLESVLDYDSALHADARAYEAGTLPLQDLVGFSESLRLLNDAGIDRIERHISGILTPFRKWLEERSGRVVSGTTAPERGSGIVAFRPPDLERTFQDLQQAGIICSVREGWIRIAAHHFNTEEEIGMLIEVLDRRVAGGRR